MSPLKQATFFVTEVVSIQLVSDHGGFLRTSEYPKKIHETEYDAEKQRHKTFSYTKCIYLTYEIYLTYDPHIIYANLDLPNTF